MSEESEPFLKFEPVYLKRVWGGRTLESRFQRKLPDNDSPFGESWEISAREEADCVVVGGSHTGMPLTKLWGAPDLRSAIFGPKAPDLDRFPLLCKILDAREKLSIQVHPPADKAEELGGEPKTEAWFIADADPGAKIYVGVRKGVTPESFRNALGNGGLEEQVHSIPVRAGQYIFIPSGRLHAIGSGILIYEIQQNSDTTYRVFDWNRVGLDGSPRDLHIEESMSCIDFEDFEPGMDEANGDVLCECDHFRIERHQLTDELSFSDAIAGRFAIITVIKGELQFEDQRFSDGEFLMIPHGQDSTRINGLADILVTTWSEQ